MTRKTRGNAFLITLVSIILLGALTFVVARQINSTSAQTISNDDAEIFASRIMAAGEEMKLVIQQMQMMNVTIDQLNFDLPSSGTFNSGNTLLKVYHPSGGGMKPVTIPTRALRTTISPTQWQIQTGTNVEWTPTAASDVIFSFYQPSDAVCKKINKKITGSETTVSLPVGAFTSQLFILGNNPPLDLDSTTCPNCVGYSSLCVSTPSGPNIYYSVVAAR